MLLRTNEIRGYEEVRGIWKYSHCSREKVLQFDESPNLGVVSMVIQTKVVCD